MIPGPELASILNVKPQQIHNLRARYDLIDEQDTLLSPSGRRYYTPSEVGKILTKRGLNFSPKSVCICNVKDGVGKTTIAVHLAKKTSSLGLKTLLVDCDKQGNATDQILPSLRDLSLLPSSLLNNTTNYKADALAGNNIQLTDGLIAAGFNQGHIEQLRRDSSLDQEEIQNSLNAFAFDLGFEDVKRKVRGPIGLIMKLLKNGQAYISEKGYESEEDRQYRELVERAEKKKEEKTKQEARLINIKFEEWPENISDREKRNFVEPIGEFMGLIHRDELKEYFKREVYNANDIY